MSERHRRSERREERTQLISSDGRKFRQPLGRTEELQQKKIYGTRESFEETRPMHIVAEVGENRRKKARRSRILWGVISLLCLILLSTLALMMAPQLLGVRYQNLPNIAFTSGGIVQMDEQVLAAYREMRESDRQDTLARGIFIDGVDVGGMTLEEAREAVERIPAGGGGEFSIDVVIDGVRTTLDSGMVPLRRDTEEVLMRAYALGRQNTQTLRQSRKTPLQERQDAREEILAHPVSWNTTLSYDMNSVRELTDGIAARFQVAPVSSEVLAFDLGTRSFTFSEDRPGMALSGDELFRRVREVLENGDGHGTVEMRTEEIIAPMTKAELMNAFHKISSYSTNTTSNKNRNINVELSAQAINGLMVGPGELFSFNLATGERTAEKGYKEANAISGGQSQPEIGGGVCQTSSTLFNAVARANLEIVARSPHAWPSSYVEKGMDATVDWPGLDFQFRNNTDWPVYIVAGYAKNRVSVEIYGMSLGDGVTIDLESRVVKTLEAPSGVQEIRNERLPAGSRRTTVKARKGYEVETYQVWYRNGTEIRRELLCTSTYKAYQETVEYN